MSGFEFDRGYLKLLRVSKYLSKYPSEIILAHFTWQHRPHLTLIAKRTFFSTFKSRPHGSFISILSVIPIHNWMECILFNVKILPEFYFAFAVFLPLIGLKS